MSRSIALRIALAAILLSGASISPSLAKVGAKCGGIIGVICGPRQFCEYPPGTCHVPDMQGTCVLKPRICSEIFLPVCGCNGKTYPNDCLRQAAGVSLAHPGKCAEKP